MVRIKEIALPSLVVYVDKDGKEYKNPICSDGGLLLPWREEGLESILESGFYYRYSA